MSDYHKLEVWKLACEFSDRVVEMVELLGPRLRPYQADQICRAADSIHENIAEGCGYNTDPLLAKHLRQAIASADEVQDELETLTRRRKIPSGFERLLPDIKTLCKRLTAFLETVAPPKSKRRQQD